jgi:Ca-activated chloride channel homolog
MRFRPPTPNAVALYFALCTIAWITGITSQAAAQSVEPASTIIIFDGSGSMWGKLDGEKKLTKLDMARDALKATLPQVAATQRTGLMSFGHRRSADCTDIETLQPLSPGDPARHVPALEKLSPRGKGPIVGALREAAKQLAVAPNSTIILIHDNADNCRQDACEVAAEIATAQPKLRVHVVGLGLDADDISRMSCVAKSTSGTFYDARDGAAVTAAITNAVQIALMNPDTIDDAAAKPGGGTHKYPPGQAIAPEGPPRLVLTAALGPKSPALTSPIRWRVTSKGRETPIYEGAVPILTLPVEAGSYDIEAAAGLSRATKTVEVGASGPTPAVLNLNSATLKLSVKDIKGGTASQSAIMTIRTIEASNAPKSPAPNRPIWIGQARDADLIIPSGAYRIETADSLVASDDTITLEAGTQRTQEIVLSAGRIDLSALVNTDGPAVDGAVFLLSKDDPDAAGGRREIARSAAAQPSFLVTAGTYYVTVRAGTTEVRQQIAVGAGDTVKKAISLGLAKLTVVAEGSSPKGSTAAKLSIATRVWSLDGGEPREVARSAVPAPEFTLAAGRYRIEAAVGTINVKAVQDVDIEAGATRKVAFKFDASTVTLKLSPTLSTTPDNVVFEVRDKAGVLLVRTTQPQSQIVLGPGQYIARCEIGVKRLEKTFDVLADSQPRTVDFALP